MNLFPIFTFAILLGLSSAALIAGCDGLFTNVTKVPNDYWGDQAGRTTYQLSITLGSNQKNVYSIYGNTEHHLVMPPSLQWTVAGANIGGVPSIFWTVFQNSHGDGWLTVGPTSGNPSPGMTSVGIDFDSWNGTNGLDVTDGEVFWMDPALGPTGPDVVLAQVTVSGYFTASLNARGRSTDGNSGWHCENITFSPPLPTCEDFSSSSCVGGSNLVISNTCATGICAASDCCVAKQGHVKIGNAFPTCDTVKTAYSATCGC